MIKVVIGVALAAVVLTSCGNQGMGHYIKETQVELKDGRSVTCIEMKNLDSGGLSCDWSNAK